MEVCLEDNRPYSRLSLEDSLEPSPSEEVMRRVTNIELLLVYFVKSQ